MILQPGGYYAGVNSGGADGGIIAAGTGQLKAGWDSGASATANYMLWQSNLTRHFGRWGDFFLPNSNEGLFTGTVTGPSGGTTMSMSFGTTMDTQLAPIVSIRDAPTVANTRGFVVSASSTTGFTVQLSGAADGAWSVYFWCFRI
jgi:hypothetical protein